MAFSLEFCQKFYKFVLTPFLLDTRPHTIMRWAISACAFYNIIPQMTYIRFHISELTDRSDIVIFASLSALAFINLFYLTVNRQGLRNYLTQLEQAVKFRTMPAQKALLAVADSKTNHRLLAVVCLMLTFVTYAGILATDQFYNLVRDTAQDSTYRLPFEMQFPFDISARGIFQLCYAATSVSALASTISGLVIDGLFFSCCYQIEALYLCLVQDFREIDNMFGYSELSAVRERLVDHKMKLLMYQHGQYIEIIKLSQEFFKPILQLKILAIALNLAILVYEATNTSFNMIFLPLFNGLVAANHIYVCCSAGACVIEASDGFATAVYDGHWYDYPMWAKRYVCMIGGMARKTKFRIFWSVNFDKLFFAKMMELSYKAYSFLRSLK